MINVEQKLTTCLIKIMKDGTTWSACVLEIKDDETIKVQNLLSGNDAETLYLKLEWSLQGAKRIENETLDEDFFLMMVNLDELGTLIIVCENNNSKIPTIQKVLFGDDASVVFGLIHTQSMLSSLNTMLTNMFLKMKK